MILYCTRDVCAVSIFDIRVFHFFFQKHVNHIAAFAFGTHSLRLHLHILFIYGIKNNIPIEVIINPRFSQSMYFL